MSVEDVNQLFVLELLRGQLGDIKEALNETLLANISEEDEKKLKNAGLSRGQSKSVMCKIVVTNVGGARGASIKHEVEELNRLSSVILALDNTIKHIRGIPDQVTE